MTKMGKDEFHSLLGTDFCSCLLKVQDLVVFQMYRPGNNSRKGNKVKKITTLIN